MPTFIVTTCLTKTFWADDGEPEFIKKRRDEYQKGITRLQEYVKDIPNTRIVIVEGNGPRKTMLDDFGVEVLYTYNNSINIGKPGNYGLKEYLDIITAISHFNIPNDEMVIKITGRYLLQPNSPFIKVLKWMGEPGNNDQFDCLIKYGRFIQDQEVEKNNHNYCVSGLIGLRCKYFKAMDFLCGDARVDRHFEEVCAKVTHQIPREKIAQFNEHGLGIVISPGLLGGFYSAFV